MKHKVNVTSCPPVQGRACLTGWKTPVLLNFQRPAGSCKPKNKVNFSSFLSPYQHHAQAVIHPQSEAMAAMTRPGSGELKPPFLSVDLGKPWSDPLDEMHDMANLISTPASTLVSRNIETPPSTPPVPRPYGGPLIPGGRNPPKFLAGPALWFMFAAQALTTSIITLYVMIMATVSTHRLLRAPIQYHWLLTTC